MARDDARRNAAGATAARRRTARAEQQATGLEEILADTVATQTRALTAGYRANALTTATPRSFATSDDVPAPAAPWWQRLWNALLWSTALDEAEEFVAVFVIEELDADFGIQVASEQPFVRGVAASHVADIEDWSLAMRRQVGEIIERGHVDSMSIPQVTELIEDAGLRFGKQATNVARTEMVSASNAASHAGASAFAEPGDTKKWLATSDSRTRDSHRKADDQVVPFDQPFIVGGAKLQHPGDRSGPLEEVINCVLPSTEVDVRATGAMVSLYSGQVVTIETTSGHKLSATPNHPVLTRRGWVPIGLLNETDYVLSRRQPRRTSIDGADIDHTPSLAEEVFHSLDLVAGPTSDKRRTAAMVDFNGHLSVGHSQVQVVTADHPLSFGWKPEELEELAKLGHAFAESKMGAASDTRPLIGIGQPQPHGLGTISLLQASVSEASVDRCATYPKVDRNRLNRLPGIELRDHAFAVSIASLVPLDRLNAERVAERPHLAADALERSAGQLRRDPKTVDHAFHRRPGTVRSGDDLTQLREGYFSTIGESEDAGANLASTAVLVGRGLDTSFADPKREVVGVVAEVSTDCRERPALVHEEANGFLDVVFWDRLRHVDRSHAETAVYDFETPDGLFAAGGVIVHNCRCTWVWTPSD